MTTNNKPKATFDPEVYKKVFVIVPTIDAKMHVELTSRLITWARRGAMPSAIVGVSPVDHARNEMVRTFLKHNYTHIFMVDADTIPPVDAIEKLMALNADVATGITPILRRQDDGSMAKCYNCFTKIEVNPENGSTTMEAVDENTGIHEVLRAGGSCLLIKRDVFWKIKEPWFLNIWNPDYTGYVGEDISFCDKVREAGMKIMCDTSVICLHNKPVML